MQGSKYWYKDSNILTQGPPVEMKQRANFTYKFPRPTNLSHALDGGLIGRKIWSKHKNNFRHRSFKNEILIKNKIGHR